MEARKEMRRQTSARFWAYLIALLAACALMAAVPWLVPKSSSAEDRVVLTAKAAPAKPVVQVDEATKQLQFQLGIRKEARQAKVREFLYVARYLYDAEAHRASVVASKARSASRAVVRSTAPVLPSGDFWSRLANCESGDPQANTGNGFQGAFQFMDSTWDSMGTAYASANLAPYSVQLDAAQRLAESVDNPRTQWPLCWGKAGG